MWCIVCNYSILRVIFKIDNVLKENKADGFHIQFFYFPSNSRMFSKHWSFKVRRLGRWSFQSFETLTFEYFLSKYRRFWRKIIPTKYWPELKWYLLVFISWSFLISLLNHYLHWLRIDVIEALGLKLFHIEGVQRFMPDFRILA